MYKINVTNIRYHNFTTQCLDSAIYLSEAWSFYQTSPLPSPPQCKITMRWKHFSSQSTTRIEKFHRYAL